MIETILSVLFSLVLVYLLVIDCSIEMMKFPAHLYFDIHKVDAGVPYITLNRVLGQFESEGVIYGYFIVSISLGLIVLSRFKSGLLGLYATVVCATAWFWVPGLVSLLGVYIVYFITIKPLVFLVKMIIPMKNKIFK